MKQLFVLMLMASCLVVSGATLDERLESFGYVDVSTLGVSVSLMYAQEDNFTGKVLYMDMDNAWLHPNAASALAKAAKALFREAPTLRLLVKDAARPMSVQRRMFNAVKGTSKANYVANPARGGGLHNYGLAVDVTLIDAEGRELPMGTPVDYLGKEAHIDSEEAMVKSGILSAQEMKNRRLLRKVMKEGGFKTIRNEWWHFQMVGRATARRMYKRLDF
ncbi:MAG: M15 family metallopeptidase [Duncaniella sp.]|nr:M15 family metallopeptidase [Duncaniella sp.]